MTSGPRPLEVLVSGAPFAGELDAPCATACDLSPGPLTRSSGRKAPSGKRWSRPLPHSAQTSDGLPPSRYSPYQRACERPRKSPRSVITEPGFTESPAKEHAAPIASPLSEVASAMKSMAVTWPVSARTRSRGAQAGFRAPPRRLAALDATDTLSKDLLTLLPGSGSVPEVPRLGTITRGAGQRRPLRLEPLPPDACPSAALLGLADL